MIKNKNNLITGAAGFISSHLTEELFQNDNFLVLFDNFNDFYSGKEEQLKYITKKLENKDYQVIEGDLLNKTIFDKIDCDIDYIFHLAPQAGVRYSLKHSSEVRNNNLVSTINLFEYGCSNPIIVNNLVEKMLKFHPKVNINEGLRDQYKWQKKIIQYLQKLKITNLKNHYYTISTLYFYYLREKKF